MTLVKFNRNRNHMPSIFNAFDEMFNNHWMTPFEKSAQSMVPAVNILEEDGQYRIEVAAPGLEKKDFAITLDDNVLTISSEKKTEESKEEDNYTRKEFNYASFKRSFTLPDSIETEKIAAAYNNGILNITLPTANKKELKPKTVEIG